MLVCLKKSLCTILGRTLLDIHIPSIELSVASLLASIPDTENSEVPIGTFEHALCMPGIYRFIGTEKLLKTENGCGRRILNICLQFQTGK